MKKKKLLSLICCLLVCMGTLSLTCYADSNKSESMVYASGEQLDQIYELLQKDSYDLKKALEVYSLTIVKESITPVYTLDLLEYAKTEKMNVVPLWKSHTGLQCNGIGNVYVAKIITSDKQYGGRIMFYIENGVAYNMMYEPSEDSPMWPGVGGRYPASSSYADHAARISTALKVTEFISVYDVKYVFIDWVGEFFYVSNNNHDRFFSIGYVSINESNKPINNVDYSMEPSELLTVAKDYSARVEAHLKEKAEWEAMHPGEMWDRVGFVGTSPIITECSHIDNVLDIASYLNIDYSLSHNQKSNDENINGTDIRAAVDVKVVLGLIVIAIIIAFSTICIILRIKKNSRKSIP